MKFTIMQKLFAVAILPIATLLIFSISHFNDKYRVLTHDKQEITHLNTMKSSSNLIHELQIERGLSASYLNKKSDEYFNNRLALQKKNTDSAIKKFHHSLKFLDNNDVKKSTLVYIENTQSTLKELTNIRDLIKIKSITAKQSFNYYTILNDYLIAILNSFNIYADSHRTNLEIATLQRIIQLQEFAGQERAVVAKLSYTHYISNTDTIEMYRLTSSQQEEYAKINFLLQNTPLSNKLKKNRKIYKNNFYYASKLKIINYEKKRELLNQIYKTIGYGGMIHDLTKYAQNQNEKFYTDFFNKKKRFDTLIDEYIIRTQKESKEQTTAIELRDSFDTILENKNAQINPMYILKIYQELEKTPFHLDSREWFEVSSQRINDIHLLENNLLEKIYLSIKIGIDETSNALLLQILLTLTTIILLLAGTYYLANKIKYSITQLENGIDDFFNFLSFKIDKPKKINTYSDDEINTMAQNINLQMDTIEDNLDEDKDFINEITQIVMLMKDGDFSERPYFEPHNPNLKELKLVFNELIELIASKIKEQTNSLERLNSSLEDRVYHQTIELENQIKDITVARDNAIQAEVAKDEFLANMSHEIRTPLNAILGFVSILKKRTTEEKSLNYLTIIDTSGKSLLTIINDILDFSKIQSGKFTISPYPINPVEEFSNASLLFASKAYEKHLVYAVYIDPNLPQSITVDAVRVKQILSNVLSNAIKFTPEDGTIKVSVTKKDSNLIISVQDSGIGIAKESVSKVFSAFEQADGSTTRKYGGTGLGLSISSKLATLMNGTLTLKSELGVGSIFTLTVPINILKESSISLIDRDKIASYTFGILHNCESCATETKLVTKYLNDFGATNIVELKEFKESGYDIIFFVPDDEYNEDIVNADKSCIALLRSNTIKLANLEHIQPLYAPFIPKAIVQAINDSNIKDLTMVSSRENNSSDEDELQFRGSVLIAEDNKTNQMLISLIMDDYGIDYTIANNGLEAIEMFKEGQYNMVLMDENMPKLNGIGAMQQIKAYESTNTLITTPIIALTASVLESDKEKFINAGMDGFVGKPINTKELESELSKYLKRV